MRRVYTLVGRGTADSGQMVERKLCEWRRRIESTMEAGRRDGQRGGAVGAHLLSQAVAGGGAWRRVGVVACWRKEGRPASRRVLSRLYMKIIVWGTRPLPDAIQAPTPLA